MTDTTADTTSNSELNQILQALFSIGILAASLFVKNPTSQQHAQSVIDLLNKEVIPQIDKANSSV